MALAGYVIPSEKLEEIRQSVESAVEKLPADLRDLYRDVQIIRLIAGYQDPRWRAWFEGVARHVELVCEEQRRSRDLVRRIRLWATDLRSISPNRAVSTIAAILSEAVGWVAWMKECVPSWRDPLGKEELEAWRRGIAAAEKSR